MILIIGIFLSIGLYLIFAGVLKLSSVNVTKAMLNSYKTEKNTTKILEIYILQLATKLSKFIKIDSYKKSRLEKNLKSSKMNISAETYICKAYIMSGSVLLLGLISLKIMPIIFPIFILMTITVYFKEIKKADEKLADKREKIESELYRFVCTIEQELKNSRDVLSILENFKINTTENFKEELEILIADMRSSSYETALTRFESKINSPKLSDVVRGLIGVLRGDDNSGYFQLLAHDFKQMELQRLKKEAQKIPPKIRMFSFLMLVCFISMFGVIIVVEIAKSFGAMF